MTNDNGSTVTIGDNNPEGKFGMNLQYTALPRERLDDGFNEHGVRENEDGSVDVRFSAMEPGTRRGVDITPDFLQNVASKNYSGRIPLQMDHSDSQRANAGYIEPGKIKFNDTLQVQTHIPNTGSSIRDDIIADFTHSPPQITDISVAFDPRSMEVDRPSNRDENPRFVDGRFREFSLTPFPAGYDNGGLTPAFSEAVEQATVPEEEHAEPESQLIQRPHTLIRK